MRKFWKSAVSGEFVSKEYAVANPSTTIAQTDITDRIELEEQVADALRRAITGAASDEEQIFYGNALAAFEKIRR